MSESTQKADKRPPDWEMVEFDYRAGIKTLRQIADENGVTHGAVNKRAKTKGWSRDLSAKIQAKVAEKVSKAAVSNEVSKQREVSERAVIEANATNAANVILEHRTDIRRGRTLFQNLLTELEGQVADPGLFEQLGELMDTSTEADDEGGRARQDKLNEIYRKVISMPGRVDSAKKLTETLEKLVKMEREAFGLNNAEQGDGDPMAGGRTITDAERAVRLLHFLRQGTPAA